MKMVSRGQGTWEHMSMNRDEKGDGSRNSLGIRLEGTLKLYRYSSS